MRNGWAACGEGVCRDGLVCAPRARSTRRKFEQHHEISTKYGGEVQKFRNEIRLISNEKLTNPKLWRNALRTYVRSRARERRATNSTLDAIARVMTVARCDGGTGMVAVRAGGGGETEGFATRKKGSDSIIVLNNDGHYRSVQGLRIRKAQHLGATCCTKADSFLLAAHVARFDAPLPRLGPSLALHRGQSRGQQGPPQ